MATTTRIISASQSGTEYTTDLNAALEAIDTAHSGATAPTTDVADGKLWLDTSTNTLKVYYGAAWNNVFDGAGVAITGGTITGITDLAVADGGTGASTAAGARTNLGLGTAATTASTDYATAAQGTLADSALQPAGDGSALTGINAHKPVAVTGTTPSLDVGTYNFFDQGALTADTTVSFASVPTDARWSYTFESPLATAYDLTVASSISSFSVASGDTSPNGISFKPDGTNMYIIGQTGDKVYGYNLSTAWDVTTAVLTQSFSVAAQDIHPKGITFKPDGTTMYVVGFAGQDVNEYSLSTAWDVSTASYVRLFSVAAQDSGPQSLVFKPDGTKMFVAGATNDNVYEYSLSTAWNVSTASYTHAFSTASQMPNPYGLTFKPDGTAMYVSGVSNNAVYEYSISTAWDVSTATYVRSFSVAPVTAPSDLAFNPDGSVMYVVSDGADEVVAYSTATYYTMTTPASVQNPPTEAITNKRTTYEFTTSDGGTNVYLINEEVL